MTRVQFTAGRTLLIGVGADLPSTVDDAKGLAGILVEPSRSAYPPEQVALLTALSQACAKKGRDPAAKELHPPEGGPRILLSLIARGHHFTYV
ncbi:MAG: hypothetical protein JW986_01975 [Methanotrichaceae archaeon]|nr:hypothetical protein [Methanotrichaceae archaeon]